MPSSQNNIPLPLGVFLLLRDLIHERIGVWFEEEKRDLLEDKLNELIAKRKMRSFLEYYFLLKRDKESEQEWLSLTEALSVQETYFWREIEQIRALVDVLVPQHIAAGHGPMKIWSAACATGEEPFTIAMALNEAGWFERIDIEIWASDVSLSALDKANRGIYRERAFRAISTTLQSKYFKTIEGGRKIDEAIKRRVKFVQANLLNTSEISALSSARYIFCRNVFIYFSAETITRVVSSIASQMPRPGYFFTGASESLLRMRTPFELEQINKAFVYLLK